MTWRLYLGDYLKHVQKLPAGSIDAVITDPPYGATDLPWDTQIDWLRFWQEIKRVCKANAVIVLFSQQPFTTDLIMSNRRDFRYELIWHKSHAVGWLNCHRRPLRAHENLLIFTAQTKGSTYNPQMIEGFRPYRTKHVGPVPHYGVERIHRVRSESARGQRYPRSVLSFTRSLPSLHPTQKPLALMEWIVKTYTNEGDLVLDPFTGSGTTGVACIASDRRFIGIEQLEEYVGVARSRLSQLMIAPGEPNTTMKL